MKIVDNVYWVGSLDPDLKRFDIVLATSRGSTYNSYLVKGEKSMALIDGTKHGFEKEYLKKLEKQIGSWDKLDVLVVNHTEPDHSYAFVEILKKAPNATVYASKPAIRFLSAIVNQSFKSVEVDEDMRLDLGGKTLRFFKTPFLHWPDTIFTYLEEDGLLFSCDAFGAHYCNPGMFDDSCEWDIEFQAHYYFDMIVRPFKEKVLQAIDKVVAAGIELKMICPSHGPILRKNPMHYVERYAEWSQPLVAKSERSILILYTSAHGNTKTMAEQIGAEFSGEKVVIMDMAETEINLIRDEFEKAKALLVGAPTILGDIPHNVWDILGYFPTVPNKIKVASAFGSFGWSGEAVPKLITRLKELKLNVCEPGLKINFTPAPEDETLIRNFAVQIISDLA